METVDKEYLMSIIDKSADELHQRIDAYRYLMTKILEQRLDDGIGAGFSLPSYPADYAREDQLKEVLKETIEVLEQTRKAFKSKILEELRKKLTRVLIESK